MNLSQDQVVKLEKFFGKIADDPYPEPVTGLHSTITNQMINRFLSQYSLNAGAKILDIGCGKGIALEIFAEKGFNVTGIDVNEEDISELRRRGFEVFCMDQSFLDFPDAEFDFVWCRHCLEHSIFPYFSLHEIFRVLKNNGYLYVEVPAPDTGCEHQKNKNHYSVFGKSMWIELISRTGFVNIEAIDITFEIRGKGTDIYWALTQQKP